MNRILFCPSIDDIVFRVALEYENLYRGTKLDRNSSSPTKREWIMGKTGINYVKKRDNEFSIYLILPSHTIKYREDRQYEGVPIGREFRLNRNLIAFTGKPKILRKEHYNHPFVLSGNELCDDNDGRWSKPPINVEWGHWYDTTSRDTMVKIARWLEEGRRILQNGYLR